MAAGSEAHLHAYACSHNCWLLPVQTATMGRSQQGDTALLLQGQVAAPGGGNDGANRGRVHSYIIDETSGVPNRQAGQMGRLASTTTICEVRFMAQKKNACAIRWGCAHVPRPCTADGAVRAALSRAAASKQGRYAGQRSIMTICKVWPLKLANASAAS